MLFTGDVATENQGYVILGPFNQDRPKAHSSFRRFADIDVNTVCFGHGQPLRGADTHKLREAAAAAEVPDPRHDPRLSRHSASLERYLALHLIPHTHDRKLAPS